MSSEKKSVDPQVLKRLLRYSKRHMGFLVVAMVSAILSTGASLYAPVLIGDGIDCILDAGQVDFTTLLPILGVLLLTVLVSAFFQWVMNLCTNQITYRTVRDIRNDAFGKLQQLPLKYIDGNPHGDLLNRMINDVDSVGDGLLQGFTQLFTGVVTIGGTIVFMLTISVPIALVVMLLTPLSLFVASFIAKRTYKQFQRQSVIKGEMGSCIEEMIENHDVVEAFGYRDRAEGQFNKINEHLHDCGVKAQFYSSLTNPCTRFVNAVVYAGVGISGAIAAINGHLSVGQLSAFLSYANQYTKPFNEISGVVTELQNAFACAGRIFQIIDEPAETVENSRVLQDCRGAVTLDRVDFSYSPDRSLIENLNLQVNPGQHIAIVGPTGCGKTTIINLLMRFYDVTSGTIRVDGEDCREVTRKSLRDCYGMVLQETWLFSGTIRENIAYGKPDAMEEEIVAAAKLARAHSFISRLEHGYDTVLGQSGGSLSQGQKQLLCIARIMLMMPPILILDEATSSIDTMTEMRIQKAFRTMTEGRTSFVVAHRLSTIREADCILVMNAGKVIEQGSHEALLAQNGFYAKLYNSQFDLGDTQ